MKMYRVLRFNIDIEEVEVERTTAHRVIFSDGRIAVRISASSRWFNTRAEALDYLLKRTRQALTKLTHQVEMHEKWIAQLSGMSLS